MNVYPLIFSRNTKYRVTRHVLFWTAWVLYFTIFMTLSWMEEQFPFGKAFLASLPEEILPMPLDIGFCYFVIYFLIPKYLSKGKYIQMVVLWLLASVIVVLLYRVYNLYGIRYIRAAFGMPYKAHSGNFAWFFFSLFSQINMEGCMTAAIKLGKMWFIKQQELDLLKKEKQKLDPALQNGKMQPVFLLNALTKVEQMSVQRPAVIPSMIHKIKNLLLYVIYDNNLTKVRLEKEVRLLEEYVALEKEGCDDCLQASVRVSGDLAAEKIAPFIIIPLAENSFRQLSLLDLARKSIDIDIRVADGVFRMITAWSKPVDSSTLGNGGNAFLHTIGQRLDLLYPQSHELKVVIRTDQFLIDCRINLRGAVN